MSWVEKQFFVVLAYRFGMSHRSFGSAFQKRKLRRISLRSALATWLMLGSFLASERAPDDRERG
jgi:hypothetical protein